MAKSDLTKKQQEQIEAIVNEQQQWDEDFRVQQQDLMKQTRAAHTEIMDGLRGKTKPITPEIQEIIDALQKNPLLVAVVKKFIIQKITEIDRVVGEVLNA